MNELNKRQIKWLRAQAHSLGHLLSLGKQGANEGFLRMLDEGLTRQELVKIRLGKHVEVDFTELAQRMNAALVQQLGRTVVLYRPAKEPLLELPE